MSRRKSVNLNLDYTLQKIKIVCRSNVVFCEKMERSGKWVSDWKRGKNLPSPEEAARMCAILQVTPEEILVEKADIDLVQGLIDSQKPEQKEKPALEGEPNKERLLDAVKQSNDRDFLLAVLNEVNKKLQEQK